MTPSSFVEYLRIRRNSGETMRVIAKDLGVAIQTVWFWCSGYRKPGPAFCRLGDVLVKEHLARGAGKHYPELEKLLEREREGPEM